LDSFAGNARRRHSELKKPLPALKNPEYLARAANRHRQKKRPAEPLDLDFEINEDHLPTGFLHQIYR
jgi:hypothetical protein